MQQPKTEKPPQFFYVTAPMPCPYVAGRMERKVVTELSGPGAEKLHDTLSRSGFRRSYKMAYAPACAGCNSCVPIRIVAGDFRPDRTQRRILKANADIRSFKVALRATHEQFRLFRRYQENRHTSGDMADMTFTGYQSMVEDTCIETFLAEFRDGSDRLVAASLVDRIPDGLSAVYNFFDPLLGRRSLGTYGILWLVEQARQWGLPYVYLGYWVAESTKMSYKERFRPCEILTRDGWRLLEDSDAKSARQQQGKQL